MRRILLYCSIVLLFSLFFISGYVFAQTTTKTPDEIAKEKGITFPIAELGNCKNFNECRNFCDDPVNKDSCILFAKKKGFYKEPQIDSQKNEILKSAKSELGCDSPSSCQAFCSQEINHDKCSSFAKSHNLGGGQSEDSSKAQILEKAKTFLGCDSQVSCKTFCEKEENRQKCSNFAKQVGLRGGEVKTGPGGCMSEETCKKFCSDPGNFEICQKFHGSVTGNPQSFHGPGGCQSPDSCKAYCEKNPQECQHMGGSQFNPQSGTSSAVPSININTKGDYCRQFPERCLPQSSYSPSPIENRPSSPSPAPPNPAGFTQTNPTIPNTNVQPTLPSTTTSTFDQATQCVKTTGCVWTGTTCICKSVQGVSTQRSLLEIIFQTLLRL